MAPPPDSNTRSRSPRPDRTRDDRHTTLPDGRSSSGEGRRQASVFLDAEELPTRCVSTHPSAPRTEEQHEQSSSSMPDTPVLSAERDGDGSDDTNSFDSLEDFRRRSQAIATFESGRFSSEDESEEGSESECGEDSSTMEDLDVYDVKCRNCSAALTRRGMRVFLCANPDELLYSTDIPMPNMRRGASMTLESCACLAERVQCGSCEEVVGYHITRPCEDCGSSEHNGHYWLFLDAHVIGECRGIHWSTLPYNGAEETAEETAADADAGPSSSEEGEQPRCSICWSCPLWKPTRLTGCGHVFCYGCISREVDARGRCPVDRLPINREMLELMNA